MSEFREMGMEDRRLFRIMDEVHEMEDRRLFRIIDEDLEMGDRRMFLISDDIVDSEHGAPEGDPTDAKFDKGWEESHLFPGSEPQQWWAVPTSLWKGNLEIDDFCPCVYMGLPGMSGSFLAFPSRFVKVVKYVLDVIAHQDFCNSEYRESVLRNIRESYSRSLADSYEYLEKLTEATKLENVRLLCLSRVLPEESEEEESPDLDSVTEMYKDFDAMVELYKTFKLSAAKSFPKIVNNALYNRRDVKNALDDLKNVESCDFRSEVEQIFNIDGILPKIDIDNARKAINFYTENIVISTCGFDFNLGRFLISISKQTTNRRIQIHCLDEVPGKAEDCDEQHPHILRGGSCCFGNLDRSIQVLVYSCQFPAACSILVQYLRSCNPEGWFAGINHWPLVSGDRITRDEFMAEYSGETFERIQ